ncbi:uncharacterized protein LOC141857460 [Brevipalpus obovatus]|uniref:uncharacterized protein LOC141857460 n=1 Tax=Brevipalpus obovatus TaxID=246614 RepID=UPI003D9F5F7D
MSTKKSVPESVKCLIIERYHNDGLNYKSLGQFRKATKRPSTKKTQPGATRAVKSWVDEDCKRTLEDLGNLIEEKFGIKLAKSTVHNYLDALNFSLRRISLVPERRNCASTIELRFTYASEFLRMDRDRKKIFFLNECGVSVSTRSNYGRSTRGSRANVTVRSIQGRNYSICAAMTCECLSFYHVQNTAYNTPHFIDYFTQFLDLLDQLDIQNAYLVMDNARFHHSEDVVELIQSRGHNLRFLPPYSPFLNPIEMMFNQLKFYIKHLKPETDDAVYEAVEHASDCITAEDCANYYDNMLEYLPKCMQKLVIEN